MIFNKKFKKLEERIIKLNEEVSNLKEKIFRLEHPPKFKLKDKVYFLNKNEIQNQGVIIKIKEEKTKEYSDYEIKYFMYSYTVEKVLYYKYEIIDKNNDIFLIIEENIFSIKEGDE